MSKLCSFSLVLCMIISGLYISGCTQMPTEKQSISDMRPQIAFKFESNNLGTARVSIDGLDMGQASDFIEGRTALKVLPGTHKLNVSLNGNMLLDEKFYLGDGVARTFVLK